jgi:hypothetical protein
MDGLTALTSATNATAACENVSTNAAAARMISLSTLG